MDKNTKRFSVKIDRRFSEILNERSKTLPGCKRPIDGSVAHALKYAAATMLIKEGHDEKHIMEICK